MKMTRIIISACIESLGRFCLKVKIPWAANLYRICPKFTRVGTEKTSMLAGNIRLSREIRKAFRRKILNSSLKVKI